jgi:CRP-like cAMP-binding protein
MDAVGLLERVIPFQFLSASRREALAATLEQRVFAPGDMVIHQGEETRELFLLAEGQIAFFDDADPADVVSVATAGQYFGEQAPLFGRPRRLSARAHGPVTTFVLSGDAFLELVEENTVFAQALGNALRDKHGVFARYQHLYARILALLDRRAFLLSDLVPAYRQLCPALHPALESDAIDVGALGYAVARLPEGVTSTSFYYMCSSLPELYRRPSTKFEPVMTKARRRASWRPLEGKLITLVRDGISDVTDMLTCLSLYAVEAAKIRRRLRSSETLQALKELVDEPDAKAGERFLETLPLSDAEREGLRRIWPEDYPRHLRNILLHHEDVGIECDLVAQDYNASASERWVSQVREAATKVVDLEDPDLEVHIISSNTHSVANCLSPYIGHQAETIDAWGRRHRPELDEGWTNPRDRLYVLARDFEAEIEGARQARIDEERASGHYRLTQSAFTGISVDLFDARRLDADLADPAVALKVPQRPTLIVNVDYAFGQQAEEILANLLFLFGQRVRSLNVLGKAGGLAGRRGDILLADATILQTNDERYAIDGNDLTDELLGELAPGRGVHRGPVLTVAGTLLQDRTLLHFYRHIHRCVGLEMEGSFFLRQLRRATDTGIVRADLVRRFAYYISDLPLSPHDNLSASLGPHEGVPPLYAITRAVLRRIFS